MTQIDVEREEEETLGVLEALNEAIKVGKIRHAGLSNETPWGIDLYMRLAKEHNSCLPWYPRKTSSACCTPRTTPSYWKVV
ncbi:MAG: hypothetical protein R2795_16895 [Saprospiraceae bacterium]